VEIQGNGFEGRRLPALNIESKIRGQIRSIKEVDPDVPTLLRAYPGERTGRRKLIHEENTKNGPRQ